MRILYVDVIIFSSKVSAHYQIKILYNQNVHHRQYH